VLRRDELGFPSFWQLQVAGSVGLYLLVLLSVLPYHDRKEFRHQTIFCATVFVTSWLLRPVCRSLLRRSLPWLVLELHAFGWSAALGAIATLVSELVKLRAVRPIWHSFLENWVPFSVIFFLWCTLYFSIKQWQQAAREKEQSARERERLVQAESEAREARLSSLRYQLNPHFLFNSLNAVSTLVLAGKTTAATRMLAQIGDLLRTTLDSNALPEVPLSQEIVFIRQYLAIEQTRLGNRLRVEMQVSPDTLEAVVPTMLLQPLVENAVRHGIAPAVEGGTIVIESSIQAASLRITITNRALGTDGISRQSDNAPRGIGLTNTAERLRVLYGDKHRFDVYSPKEGEYQVKLEIPLRNVASDVEGGVCVH
jgi:two-component system, LytTR family, sensor kinase